MLFERLDLTEKRSYGPSKKTMVLTLHVCHICLYTIGVVPGGQLIGIYGSPISRVWEWSDRRVDVLTVLFD